MKAPILMDEAYWKSTPFSIAKYYGGIKAFGKKYLIVDENGNNLFELSNPKSKCYVDNNMAIEPNKPADLVIKEWIPIYNKLGREKFIELINRADNIREAKQIIKEGKQ